MHTWYNNGGDATLYSYNLIKYTGGLTCVENPKGMAQFLSDIEWLKTLPLYIELDETINDKPLVISHASCGDVWHHHDNPNGAETFKEYALWHRIPPKKETPIYNIYGHTPVEFGVEIEDNYTNVDTGCYIKKHGYNELSAFCVQSGEVISIQRIE
jgi:hypothetical protein